ncbi:hypothetical protein FGM00_00570 [Aggregatimonas sangjinii]|uniref:Lipoprotein n=1 Tax=Aggregatimonas sangjinii TaxID=2583587 RepID=A0A5B7SNT7_9FLAO|nr:hypothetical protein [Aggregatimonas sangjinii]QCW98687.1 hypothetical protein FGM00_00570 [Aggregatimonas sangjinii]
MRHISPVLSLFLILSCSTDQLDGEGTLDAFTDDIEVVPDNVIACAASNENDDLISVFLYPRDGAANIQYFETETTDVDKNDLKEYRPKSAPIKDVFNGYLKKFEVSLATDRWVIIAFDEGGKRHLSNPIRIKQQTKPTEYLPQNISVDSSSTMPNFTWQDGAYSDTKIYFQVVSDSAENLLSGTYTFERNFQYYDLENVVLNITKNNPSALKSGNSYGFSLLAVSEDNWVNQFSSVSFTIE